ncbi:protein AMN1 homolog [Aethina tumida]|uniref:protein AMN1 homolog n=1 Tax=Aethina tumida TaxID=116153 RepID=UPI00096B159A|nr:protein AMN1 homolog [Aethina tumida]
MSNRRSGRKACCLSLIQGCVDEVATNIEKYPKEDIICMPPSLKDKLLVRITHSHTLTNTLNLEYCLPLLFHSRTRVISLRNVRTANIQKVSEELVNEIGKCQELRVLMFPAHVRCSPKVLKALFIKLPKLEQLFMTYCSTINDEVIQVLSYSCPKLRYCNLTGSKVDNPGMMSLGRLTDLVCIAVSETPIGHEGISALVEGPSGKNLKELKIDNCVNVTEATLRKIVECCPDMEILIFYNCDRSISEMMFTPQENQLKNLKQLSWTINW